MIWADKSGVDMKNKLFFLLILGIFLISSVSSLDSQGVGKQNQNFTLEQSCNGASYITIDTIKFPDNTVKIIGQNMTFVSGGTFHYNFTTTEQVGKYFVNGISDGCQETFVFYFEITPSGRISTTSESILYFVMVLVMGGINAFLFYFILVLPYRNQRGEDGSVTDIVKLKYLKVVFIAILYAFSIILLNLINGLANNFTTLSIFAGQIGFIQELLIRIVLPFYIVIFIWIIVLLIKDTNYKKLMKAEAYYSG